MREEYQVAIWDAGGVYFIPLDLKYFHKNFVCEPMIHSWKPPPFEVVRKRKKACDFSSWMAVAPVITEKALTIIAPHCNAKAEFLPFYESSKSGQLFAVNVLSGDSSSLLYKKDKAGRVYASRKLGELARDFRLTGLCLQDPSANNILKAARGEDSNTFPGLVR